MTPIKHYIRDVRRLMSVYGRKEKRFLEDLKADLQNYSDEHPENSDYKSLIHEFGSPKETCIDYLLSQDDRYLIHTTRIRRLITAIILIICIFFITIAGTTMYYQIKMNEEWRSSINKVSEMEHTYDIGTN